MPKTSSGLRTFLLEPRDIQMVPAIALRSVTSKTGLGVFASSDRLYKNAVFGRDSLEVAEDLVSSKPKLVRDVLTTLGSLQGQVSNPINEEEPGKIVHEYRSRIVDGKPIDDVSMNIFKTLSQKWGGDENEMAYYGSVDATLLYIRTIDKYCRLYGHSILRTTVTLRSGEKIEIREVVKRAADWTLRKLEKSKSGLIEFHKTNPHGISNQVWKDSEEFYVHKNGRRANHSTPISSIELQGLAFDALMAVKRLIPSATDEYEKAALKVRKNTFKHLWINKKQMFVLGTDYESGHLRRIETKTANPAALLDTTIFDDLREGKRQMYITSLIEQITSLDFLTDAGVRSRALSEAGLVGHWDYHGSYVSWPKETYDIAKGLRRQGFPKLARQLENRILNVCLKYKAYPEFVYVDHRGRVLASAPSSHTHGEFILVEGSNQPERIQAWTVSAVTAILSIRIKQKILSKTKKSAKISWQNKLETKMLTHVPFVDRHFNPLALAAKYPTYHYKVTVKTNS